MNGNSVPGRFIRDGELQLDLLAAVQFQDLRQGFPEVQASSLGHGIRTSLTFRFSSHPDLEKASKPLPLRSTSSLLRTADSTGVRLRQGKRATPCYPLTDHRSRDPALKAKNQRCQVAKMYQHRYATHMFSLREKFAESADTISVYHEQVTTTGLKILPNISHTVQ